MIDKEHPMLKGFPLFPVTVVGSYPLTPTPDQLMKSYYAKEDPYLDAISQCVKEQVKAGIQIITDGQTRANMVNIFASKLAGIRMKGKPVVFSEVRFTEPITVADQEYVQNIIRQLEEEGGSKGQEGGRDKGDDENGDRWGNGSKNKIFLKGIITGPYTMSQSVSDNYYKDEKELAFAFASALNQEAKALQEIVPLIQFDEPFFSVNFIDYSRELITRLVEGITVPVVLHACGDVSAIFSDLIELPVNILDNEYTANPHLLDVVKEYDFSQMIGFGSVRSDHMKVETLAQIKMRLEKAVKYFGAERLLVDPDCGMKHLTEHVAFEKLRNMRQARDEVMKDFSE